MSKGYLYLFWMVVIRCCSCGRASFITCDEGTAQTSVYIVNYSVEKRHVSFFGCQKDSDRKSELAMPPGAPWEVIATLAGSNLTFTWRPPDDGSVQFLAGFLVEVYVDIPNYLQAGPDACYIVNLGTSLRIIQLPNNLNSYEMLSYTASELDPDCLQRECIVTLGSETDNKGAYDRNCPLPQDAIFRLNCNATGLDRGVIDVISVMSLPMPKQNDDKTKLLNMGHYVNGKWDNWTTWSTCTHSCKENIRTYDRTCETQHNEKQDSKPMGSKIVTPFPFIVVGVLCISIVVVIFVYRIRKLQTSKASTTFSEDSSKSIILNTNQHRMNNQQDHANETITDQTELSPVKHSSGDMHFQRRLYSKRDHICYKNTEQDGLLTLPSSPSSNSPSKYISPAEHDLDAPIPEHVVFLPPEPLHEFTSCVTTFSPSLEPDVDISDNYTSLPPKYTSMESHHQDNHSVSKQHESVNISVDSATFSSASTNCHSTESTSINHSQNSTLPKFFKDFITEVNIGQ